MPMPVRFMLLLYGLGLRCRHFILSFSKVLERSASGSYWLRLFHWFWCRGFLASENWHDHDRSGRYMTRDYAKNYLESCAPNAILFTYGDNDTFPLWYVQEVEGVRPDIKIINLSYLGMDWYITSKHQMASMKPHRSFFV